MIIKLKKIDRKICTTVKQLFVMVKSIPYEGTIALGMSINFTKALEYLSLEVITVDLGGERRGKRQDP